MSFSKLGLIEPLQRALASEGYSEPTPIQIQAIPRLLEGKDLLGCAQTGTGKTAAFSLPLLQLLAGRASSPRLRALVLAPTRELAAQIAERIGAYGRHLSLGHAVVFGGVSQMHQERALRSKPAILVATPGRLLDLCNQRVVDLSGIEILVLDEADRMLDMGFIHDVRKIVALIPRTRQTLLFSATMPPDIVSLAKNILVDPVRVDVAPAKKTADRVEQSLYFVPKPHKRALLEHVLADRTIDRALVFTRTKHGADRVAKHLTRASIPADAIHGDKTQGARERALSAFRSGEKRILVATDIAARGIDVDGVSHVVNFDLPMDAESYVHRIGRTARAGASGFAVSFCDDEERTLLASIEKLIGARIPVVAEHALSSAPPPPPAAPAPNRVGQRPGRGDSQRGGHGRGGEHQARDRHPSAQHRGEGQGGHHPGGARHPAPQRGPGQGAQAHGAVRHAPGHRDAGRGPAPAQHQAARPAARDGQGHGAPRGGHDGSRAPRRGPTARPGSA